MALAIKPLYNLVGILERLRRKTTKAPVARPYSALQTAVGVLVALVETSF